MGISKFFNSFINGMAFGLFGSPFCGCCYGGGSGISTVDFGTFANPFPTIFTGNMGGSSPQPSILTNFANPCPSISFSGIGESIWNMAMDPNSETNKQLREMYSNTNNNNSTIPLWGNNNIYQQYEVPFSPYYMPTPYQYLPQSYVQQPAAQLSNTVNEQKTESSAQETQNNNENQEINIPVSNFDVRQAAAPLAASITNTTPAATTKTFGKIKHWSKMTDDEMKEVYGNYTRDITTLYQGTASDLNRFLNKYKKSVLKDHGDAFIKAQEKYNINALVLLAICGIETSYGTKGNAIKGYFNVANIEKPKKASYPGRWRRFNNVEECIMELARLLRENYVNNSGKDGVHLTKLYQINAKYCPGGETKDNVTWAGHVETLARDIESIA